MTGSLQIPNENILIPIHKELLAQAQKLPESDRDAFNSHRIHRPPNALDPRIMAYSCWTGNLWVSHPILGKNKKKKSVVYEKRLVCFNTQDKLEAFFILLYMLLILELLKLSFGDIKLPVINFSQLASEYL